MGMSPALRMWFVCLGSVSVGSVRGVRLSMGIVSRLFFFHLLDRCHLFCEAETLLPALKKTVPLELHPGIRGKGAVRHMGGMGVCLRVRLLRRLRLRPPVRLRPRGEC